MPVMLTNVLLLILWLRLLPQRDEKTFFNPYVAGGVSFADRILRFLQPVLGALPPYAAATLVLVFLIAFRGIVAAGVGLDWVETMGLWRISINNRSPGASLWFSFLSFGWLLHRLWTLEWVLTLLRPKTRDSRASAALSAFAMPVSAVPVVSRGIFLLLFGAVLGASLARVGFPNIPIIEAADPSLVLPAVPETGKALLVMSVGAMTDVLAMASQFVMIFIILSFFGTIMGSQPTATIGTEGIDLIVGSVVPRPITVGGMSFAPIVFFIVAGLLHTVVLGVLYQFLTRTAA